MLPDLKKCNIAVIGLGYVGLPLAIEFAKSKKCLISNQILERNVIGFDINNNRIDELKKGFDSTHEISNNELNLIKNIKYSCNVEDLEKCDVFIVSVPTPINSSKTPDLNNLKKASKMVGSVLKKRSQFNRSKLEPTVPVVIFESTVYPGMTEEVCIPILSLNSNLTCGLNSPLESFVCGYSPERINPGDKKNTLVNVVKVTSGTDHLTAKWIDNLYGSIINAGTKLAKSIKVAEAAKVIENTQRDLNIALINELAVIFSHLKIDTLDVLDVASTKWNFLNFKPGLVGGHCIGVDPYYLTYKAQQAGYFPEVVLAGRRINDNMGSWIVEKIIKNIFVNHIDNFNKEALVLGFTFKENCSDIRNTKVVDIVNNLRNYDINAHVIDPHADKEEVLKEYGYQINNEFNKEKKYKLVILAVAHTEFLSLTLSDWESFGFEDCLYVDIKGIIPRSLNPLRI